MYLKFLDTWRAKQSFSQVKMWRLMDSRIGKDSYHFLPKQLLKKMLSVRDATVTYLDIWKSDGLCWFRPTSSFIWTLAKSMSTAMVKFIIFFWLKPDKYIVTNVPTYVSFFFWVPINKAVGFLYCKIYQLYLDTCCIPQFTSLLVTIFSFDWLLAKILVKSKG